MHIILFEDADVQQLFPATIGRAAFMLSVGSYRLIDLVSRLACETEVIVRPYLHDIVAAEFPNAWKPERGERNGPILILNARAVPSVALMSSIQKWIAAGKSGVVKCEHSSRIACALLQGDATPIPHHSVGVSQLIGIVHDMNLPPLEGSIPLLQYPHDLIRYQLKIMNDNLNDRLKIGPYKEIETGVFADEGVSLGKCLATDTKAGPIIIESGVKIAPFCFLRGPLYIGKNCKIIEHSAMKDFVTLGETTKVGGEVEASIIEPYSNKQHHGFLGHSYLGSWVNLGAGTCNSDLKNTYGEVAMEYGGKKVKSGMQFLGCIIGDYSKTAINTSIFTGKVIGSCSMVYGFVTTNVPSFVNYARSFGQVTESTVDVLVSSQARMFGRRNIEQRPCDIQLLKDIYEMTKHERQLANEPLAL